MKKTLLIALATLIIFPMAADAGNRKRQRHSNRCSLQLILKDLVGESLSTAEVDDLLLMREEEKLARDVYLSLYEEWEVKAFRNIAKSKKNHMKAVLTLLRKYELDDPARNAAIGVFQNDNLQALYGKLFALGSSFRVNAFTVGAAIEEMDIFDLQQALGRADNEDIQTLYQNLMKGSRNHLRAFVQLLAAEDGAYEPGFLSQAQYDEIVDSAKEKGGVLDAAGNYVCGATRNRRRGN